MAEEILNPEINTEPEINEDELFVIVDNNLSDSEKIDAPRYSYWRSVVRSFFKNKVNIIAIVSLVIILDNVWNAPFNVLYVYTLAFPLNHFE